MKLCRRGRWIAPVLAVLGAGCWHTPASQPFSVTRVFPALSAEAAPLMLNDAITVYFSATVDPLSVTSDSVAVLDAAGHPVPGRLRVEGAWVTFEPVPPLLPTLDDGSLEPDSEYSLLVAGYPRPDGVRAVDGRHLFEGVQHSFRTARRDSANRELPAPLRPVYSQMLPLVVKPIEGDVLVPVDDPRLRLHFTLPILPTSLTRDAFALTLVRLGSAKPVKYDIEPRAVRLLPQVEPIDDYPGCTVEIELARRLRLAGGRGTVELCVDDYIGLVVVSGDKAIRDYSGRFHQEPPSERSWSIVTGNAVTVVEWPGIGEQGLDERLMTDAVLGKPGFEFGEQGSLRPLVRVEAGDGSLGLFRPTRDMVLMPGEPFDRGDGVIVRSRGRTFPFLAVDVPTGVTVRVDARSGPVQILVVDRARIAGTLVVEGAGFGLPPADREVDVSLVMDSSAVSLLAAGGIEISGKVEGLASPTGAQLALITSGRLALGPVPAGTILATELGSTAVGTLDTSCVSVQVQLTAGLPSGVELTASGSSVYRSLPPGISGGRLRLDRCDPAIRVAWQATSPDPVDPMLPDRTPARSTPLREIVDGERIDGLAGQFLRIRCQVSVRGGQRLPTLGGVRLLGR